MQIWKAALLGLFQGLTEFFPVSSKGHLLALERWLSVRKEGSGASLEALLHLGPLAAIGFLFRRELGAMLRIGLEPRRLLKPGPTDTAGQDARFLVLGTLATVIGSLPYLHLFEKAFDSKTVLVVGFLVTTVELVLVRFCYDLPAKPVDALQALLVGAAQVFALIPGISRSCTTMFVGLLVGIPLARVAALSFLLSFPVALGATALELMRFPPNRDEILPALIGVGVAFVSAWIAMRTMLTLVPERRMHWFAPYVLAFAATVWLTV